MTRLATAAVLIPIVVYAVFWGPWWDLLGTIGVIAALCYIEYCQILKIDRHAGLLGFIAGAGLLVMPVDRVFIAMLLFALVTLGLTLRAENLQASFAWSSAMFLGVFYTFGAMKTAYLLGIRGSWWLFVPLAVNWIGDSGAYYVGRRFGKHKLAPRISPGKSWEGSLASLLLSTVFSVLILPRVLPVPVFSAALLALVGNLAGQVGDLSESALKRLAGVKDSGKLLPGHGGMLDRVDSVLFTLPVFYALTLWLRL